MARSVEILILIKKLNEPEREEISGPKQADLSEKWEGELKSHNQIIKMGTGSSSLFFANFVFSLS